MSQLSKYGARVFPTIFPVESPLDSFNLRLRVQKKSWSTVNIEQQTRTKIKAVL